MACNYFHRARETLGLIFDETDHEVALVLHAMGILSLVWLNRKDIFCYYQELCMEICGRANVLNSELYRSCLMVQFLYHLTCRSMKSFASTQEYWNSYQHQRLIEKLSSQGNSHRYMISSICDIVDFLCKHNDPPDRMNPVESDGGLWRLGGSQGRSRTPY